MRAAVNGADWPWVPTYSGFGSGQHLGTEPHPANDGHGSPQTAPRHPRQQPPDDINPTPLVVATATITNLIPPRSQPPPPTHRLRPSALTMLSFILIQNRQSVKTPTSSQSHPAPIPPSRRAPPPPPPRPPPPPPPPGGDGNPLWLTSDEQKIKLKGEVHRLVAPRDQKYQSNFVEFRNNKIVYRRYAGLFFCACVDTNDNELAYLEAIHFFVEVLDAFFGNVCELDLVFNFYKVYAILDEVFLAGEIEETSKQVVLTRLEHLDKLE
ncbi:hypothetical protein Purlil1_8119 [Purpureocillium lilacinum]|uniref:AP-2 complex subunit sigma n=1 Tax=Purpureocillium lilacinum TaxID=33203 RepID=A0ABR0BU25_PURLI|nr:hypothetical protein Purlil1_8119 [Purpureocillium lilacinum]